MDTARTSCCRVYLHPAAASNPATVSSIQRATGRLVVIADGRPQLKAARPSDDFGPFGGDAA